MSADKTRSITVRQAEKQRKLQSGRGVSKPFIYQEYFERGEILDTSFMQKSVKLDSPVKRKRNAHASSDKPSKNSKCCKYYSTQNYTRAGSSTDADTGGTSPPKRAKKPKASAVEVKEEAASPHSLVSARKRADTNESAAANRPAYMVCHHTM